MPFMNNIYLLPNSLYSAFVCFPNGRFGLNIFNAIRKLTKEFIVSKKNSKFARNKFFKYKLCHHLLQIEL